MSTRKATIRVSNRQSLIRCDIKSKVISSDYSNIREIFFSALWSVFSY